MSMNTFFHQKLKTLKEDKNLVVLKGLINRVKFDVFDCFCSVLLLLLLWYNTYSTININFFNLHSEMKKSLILILVHKNRNHWLLDVRIFLNTSEL